MTTIPMSLKALLFKNESILCDATSKQNVVLRSLPSCGLHVDKLLIRIFLCCEFAAFFAGFLGNLRVSPLAFVPDVQNLS